MWPFGGLILVLLGLLPSAWHWLTHAQPGTLWQAAACYTLIDGAFALAAVLFVFTAIQYGETRSKQRPAPYPGAWVEHDGHQQAPRGFAPGYLSFALVVSLMIPSVVLLLSSGTSRPLAFATLGPYLLVFIPQIALETKYLNRSFMTPALPLLFMYYRLWQFIRSLQLVAEHRKLEVHGAAGAGQHWLTTYLLSLLVFWVFDTGCTIIWLPWMFNWQLQDPKHLSELTKLREQEQEQAARQHHPAGPTPAATHHIQDGGAMLSSPAANAHGMTTRSKARTPGTAAARSRKADSSAEIDSYGYGS